MQRRYDDDYQDSYYKDLDRAEGIVVAVLLSMPFWAILASWYLGG